MCPVTITTVLNTSGIASSAMRMPIPSTGNPTGNEERRENEQTAARNARNAEAHWDGGDADRRHRAKAERDTVEFSNEQSGDDPRRRSVHAKQRHAERERDTHDLRRNTKHALRAIDHRGQRRNRRPRAERHDLRRKRGTSELAQWNAAANASRYVQQRTDSDEHSAVRHKKEHDGAGKIRPEMQREPHRQHETHRSARAPAPT